MKHIALLLFISSSFFSCKDSIAPIPLPEPEIETEFLINTNTEGDQTNPQVAALDSGNFVVVWRSTNDDQNYLLKGQFFNYQGMKIGTEFYITTEKSNYPHFKVTSILNGFYVQWKYYDDTHIYSLAFDADGYRMGSIVAYDIGLRFDFNNVDTATLTNNTIITICITWNYTFYLLIWDQTGQNLMHCKTITPEPENYYDFPRVCGVNDSLILVVWTHQEYPPMSNHNMHLKQQFFMIDGTPKGQPKIIMSYPPAVLSPEVIPMAAGYVVFWNSGFSQQLMAQYFNQDGDYRTDPTILKGGGGEHQIFRSGLNYFTVLSFGNDVILDEYRVGSGIGAAASFTLNALKTGFLSAGNGTKILDNRAVAVWYGAYADDYDIYGRIIEYYSYMY